MAKVSIIVPSRNERFLVPTVEGLLAKAAGDVELVVVLEGYHEHALPYTDKRLKVLHHGKAKGMRDAINAAVQIATGTHILKCDGHVMWDEGYDQKLLADYHEDNWILTPRRYALDAEKWCIETGNSKYPIDYEYLSYGLERPDDPTCGFHGTEWRARREARKDIQLDADMSSQGSAWMMSRRHWDRQIKRMDISRFGSFFGESQEIGLQTQLAGGAMMRTKRTFYAHLRKSAKWGRGYSLGPNGHRRGASEMVRMCMLDQWPGQTRTLRSLVEEFSPVPGWPLDLDRCFREAKERLLVAA